MLINYKVKGYKAFNEEVHLDFRANKKIKNKDYVFSFDNNEILKSAIIYGPNNTGKSSLIESISLLKKIIFSGSVSEKPKYEFDYNLFNDKKIIEYQIEFSQNESRFNYFLSFEYKEGIINEVLYVNEEEIFDRNKKNSDESLRFLMDLAKNYKDKLIISMLPNDFHKFTILFNEFFEKLYILEKDIDFAQVITDITSMTKADLKKYTDIIKSADISIDNLEVFEESNKEFEQLRLFSSYKMKDKNKKMPSIITDSDGTKVFMYYILQIQKCLKNGGIIVVDEIDRSLHTLLTKSIVSLFNDEKNINSQLIATSHDLLLLDCLYLFRKDQIWFTYKDENQVYLYSLNNYVSNKDNQIRNKTLEAYLKGMFGALPHPNIERYIFDE